MSDMPHGWENATVLQLAGQAGLVTDGDWIESKDQDLAGDVRLVQLGDIGDGAFRNRSERFVTSATAARLNCTYLQPGDLLIARMPDPLGRACIFPGVDRPAITAVDVFVWRAGNSDIVPRWLMHFINSPDRRAAIASEAGGTTRNRIAGGRLKQLTVPTPPLAEQHRIVSKIDGLLAKSKRARDHVNHVPRLVELYKKSVVDFALRGDLTRTWRANSSGLSKWKTLPAAELFRWASGKNLTSKAMRQGAIPVLGGNGINGYHDTALVHFPTVVIGRVGAQCGNVHLSETPAWITDNAIYASSFSKKNINLKYAVLVFRHADLNVRAGGSGQPYVNQTILNEVAVVLPPVEEQDELVRRVEKAFAWIDRLASETTSARKLIDHLDRAILSKAFRGELVPQDPNDEPASVLLERINAEGMGAAATRRGRGRPRLAVS